MPTAQEIIDRLSLAPHPEGGYFRETYRAQAAPLERSAGTAIYFLLAEGQSSHWHRIDAAEIWHFYAGDALQLRVSTAPGVVQSRILGNRLDQGHLPQSIVPPGAWQAARTLGAWTLVGCTVSPAFSFDTFELAPPDFEP